MRVGWHSPFKIYRHSLFAIYFRSWLRDKVTGHDPLSFWVHLFNVIVDGQFTVYNYWMRLSMMWRIMQIEESVRPKWIAASEISIILEKPNWVIVSLLIQNISTFLTSLPPPFLAPALKCFRFLLYTSAWPGRGKLIVLDFFFISEWTLISQRYHIAP